MDADLVFAETQNPLAVHAGDADDAVIKRRAVHRPFTAIGIAEDRGDRGVPREAEVGEGAVIPDGRRCEFLSRADCIIRVRRIGRDGPPSRNDPAAVTFWITSRGPTTHPDRHPGYRKFFVSPSMMTTGSVFTSSTNAAALTPAIPAIPDPSAAYA